MKRVILLALGASLLLAGGCANQNTVFRTNSIVGRGNPGQIVTADAKQSSVLVVKTNADRKSPYLICAQPPPDALSAQSLSTSGELGLLGINSPSEEVRLKAALALSETASSIERTQTINLLRESMYRTCERYMNGAITEEEFIVQSARDQRAMVAILAIEQLTRTIRPPNQVLTPGATSASLGGGSTVKDDLVAATKARVTAEKAASDAKDAYDKLNKDKGEKCPTVEDKTQAEVDAGKLDAALWKDCSAAKKLRTSTADTAELARAQQASLERVLANAGGTAATTSAVATVAGKPDPADAPAVGKVAQAVLGIVMEANKFDEAEMMCVAILRRKDQPVNGKIQTFDSALVEACQARLLASAYADLKKVGLDRPPSDAVATIMKGLDTQRSADVAALWVWMGKNGNDVTKLANAAKAAGVDESVGGWETLTPDKAVDAFGGLSTESRQKILGQLNKPASPKG